MSRFSFFCICFLAVFSSEICRAQNADTGSFKTHKPYFYGYYGAGMGTGENVTISTGLTYIQSNNWGLSGGLHFYSETASELPWDYSPGIQIFEPVYPRDEFWSYNLKLVREIGTPSVFFRFGIEAGPALIVYKKAHFTENINPGIFESNYYCNYSKEAGIGFTLRTRCDLPFTRFAGVQLVFLSNINAYSPYIGGELNLNAGRIRERTVKENQRRMNRNGQ